MNKKLKNWFLNSGSTTDADAQAFFTAAGITDATQKSAVNTLVTGLKSNNLWTKFYALYPIVGGSATTHKYNLKDPRDLDAAFRLSFTGGWTHASTGMTPNGSTGFANTFFNPTTYFTNANGFMSLYSRTNSNAGTPYDMGNTDGSTLFATIIVTRYTDDKFYFGFSTSTYGGAVANADSRGLFSTSISSAANYTGYKNGAVVGANAEAIVSFNNIPIYLGAINKLSTGASLFSTKELAFAGMADSLTDPQNATLYTLIQAYQTALSRQV